jgi:hypothetical protein
MDMIWIIEHAVDRDFALLLAFNHYFLVDQQV